MRRAVLGVPVQRQVGQHQPEAVGQLLDQRLPLAVRQPGGVEQRERRPGARLAVGDPRPVVVVVEAELHGARPILESDECNASGHRLTTARSSGRSRARRPGGRAALRACRHRDRRPPRDSAARFAGDRRGRHVDRVHGLQLPHLRHDGPGRAAARRPASARGRARRRAGAVARAVPRRGPVGRDRGARRPARGADGRGGEVAGGAVTYLRIAALGAPAFMLASAGQGFLRGVGDLTTPLVILVAAHAANVVLELLFVYGFDWGLAGSAWGTVIAQLGMGAAFLAVQLRAGWQRPVVARMRALMRIGSEIAVRTTALLGAFLVASAVLARIGAASLGAHQIAFQLFIFLALSLDALAIAAQVMVGRMLGAGDAAGARAAAGRIIAWSTAVGAAFGVVLLALGDVIPRLFTGATRSSRRRTRSGGCPPR